MYQPNVIQWCTEKVRQAEGQIPVSQELSNFFVVFDWDFFLFNRGVQQLSSPLVFLKKHSTQISNNNLLLNIQSTKPKSHQLSLSLQNFLRPFYHIQNNDSLVQCNKTKTVQKDPCLKLCSWLQNHESETQPIVVPTFFPLLSFCGPSIGGHEQKSNGIVIWFKLQFFSRAVWK